MSITIMWRPQGKEFNFDCDYSSDDDNMLGLPRMFTQGDMTYLEGMQRGSKSPIVGKIMELIGEYGAIEVWSGY